jgi:hypothetical protein
MSDIPQVTKEWSGLGAAVGVAILAVLQGLSAFGGNAGSQLAARANDQDEAMARVWESIQTERLARVSSDQGARDRLRALELTVGKLEDRSQDQRQLLTSMNNTLSEMKRDQAVIGERVNNIARQVGADRQRAGSPRSVNP